MPSIYSFFLILIKINVVINSDLVQSSDYNNPRQVRRYENGPKNMLSVDSPSPNNSSITVAKNAQDTIPSTEIPTDFYSESERIPRAALRCEQFSRLYERFGQGGPKSNCSSRSRRPRKKEKFTIRGGVRAVRGLSHIVALGSLNDNKQFVLHCGGTLIDSKWVLTAAHCTHSVSGGLTIARVGIERLSDNEGTTVSIIRTIRHPSYKPPALYADIALLELETNVLTKKVKPACLRRSAEGSLFLVWISGWGATEYGGNESDTLQKAVMRIVNSVECEREYNGSTAAPYGVAQSMVCARAWGDDWQQDTCSGDSGGPLYQVHPKWSHLHQLVGVTSFGSNCAFPGLPGVYTSVPHYIDWIEDILWSDQ